jgi:hypothetical protein
MPGKEGNLSRANPRFQKITICKANAWKKSSANHNHAIILKGSNTSAQKPKALWVKWNVNNTKIIREV